MFGPVISHGSFTFNRGEAHRPAKFFINVDSGLYTASRTQDRTAEMQATIPRARCAVPDPSWLSLPAERSAAFLPIFARISVALQSTLRQRVPPFYFQSLESFRDWKSAYPMLIYQASRPFRGRVRTELTYDVLNPRLMAILFRRAKGNLELLLEQTEAELRAGGRPEVAAHYSSRRAPEIVQSVQRLSASRRYLYRLVRSESALVDALVELSGLGTLSAREQAKRLAAFRKKWQFQLRRLYPGGDFSALAPALEEAVTEALISVGDGPTEGYLDRSLIAGSEPGSGIA
jgi:hypothetical protein